MNITLKQLRAFLGLAGSQSFAEAAEQLHISQPALSVSIKNLETEVGGSLFSRSTRSLTLSPEGRAFLATAKRLLTDWDEAFDDLHRAFNLQQGKISVAVMPSFAMNQFPEALRSFRKRYPAINISVVDIVMESVLEAVRVGQVELGITFEPEQLDGVDFTPLFSDHFIAVVAASSPLATQGQLSWKTLAEQPFIAMNRGSWTRDAIDEAMQRAKVRPNQLMEAKQLATIARMVSLDLGVSVVPSLCRQHMDALDIVCKPLSKPCIVRRVGIFSRKRHPLSTAAEAMKSVLIQQFSTATS